MQASRNGEAVGGEPRGRFHHGGPVEPAETPMQLEETPRRAGHPDRQRGPPGRVGHGFALWVEEHVGGRGGRRHLAEVEAREFTVETDDGEATTAEIAGGRVNHGQCQGSSDRGIDRVAALFQRFEPSAGRRVLGRHHGPTEASNGGKRGRRQLTGGECDGAGRGGD